MDLYFALYEEELYTSVGYTSTLFNSAEAAKASVPVMLNKIAQTAGKKMLKAIAPPVVRPPKRADIKCLGIYVFNTETLKVNKVGEWNENN